MHDIQKRRMLTTIIVLVALLVALVLSATVCVKSAYTYVRGRQVEIEYIPTVASVTEIIDAKERTTKRILTGQVLERKRFYKIKYQYMVGACVYVGEGTVHDLPGTNLTIYYNPQAPEKSVIERSELGYRMILLPCFIIGMVVVVLLKRVYTGYKNV